MNQKSRRQFLQFPRGGDPGQSTMNTEIHAYVTITQQFKYAALRLKRIVPERCFNVHEPSSVPVSISTWCTVNGKFRIKGNDPKKRKKKKTHGCSALALTSRRSMIRLTIDVHGKETRNEGSTEQEREREREHWITKVRVNKNLHRPSRASETSGFHDYFANVFPRALLFEKRGEKLA